MWASLPVQDPILIKEGNLLILTTVLLCQFPSLGKRWILTLTPLEPLWTGFQNKLKVVLWVLQTWHCLRIVGLPRSTRCISVVTATPSWLIFVETSESTVSGSATPSGSSSSSKSEENWMTFLTMSTWISWSRASHTKRRQRFFMRCSQTCSSNTSYTSHWTFQIHPSPQTMCA